MPCFSAADVMGMTWPDHSAEVTMDPFVNTNRLREAWQVVIDGIDGPPGSGVIGVVNADKTITLSSASSYTLSPDSKVTVRASLVPVASNAANVVGTAMRQPARGVPLRQPVTAAATTQALQGVVPINMEVIKGEH